LGKSFSAIWFWMPEPYRTPAGIFAGEAWSGLPASFGRSFLRSPGEFAALRAASIKNLLNLD
jgi:hypothetical protein